MEDHEHASRRVTEWGKQYKEFSLESSRIQIITIALFAIYGLVNHVAHLFGYCLLYCFVAFWQYQVGMWAYLQLFKSGQNLMRHELYHPRFYDNADANRIINAFYYIKTSMFLLICAMYMISIIFEGH